MRLVAATLLTVLAAAPAAAEPGSSLFAATTAGTDAARRPHTLPFLAEEALKRGYELPLPLGLSGVFYYVERDVEITDVRLGINGAPLRSVSNFVNLGSRSHVSVAVGRVDAWLLPFLNVYGFVGYVHNDTTTRGIATIPAPGPLPGSRTINLSARTEMNGFLGGAGFTAAAGYREFFALADLNYSQTDIGFDDRFRALIGTIRAGWNGKILDAPTRFWVGAMYWGTRSTAKSTVNSPDAGAVSFEADQGPVHPFNPIIGASTTLGRHWDVFFEYGSNGSDVQSFATGVTFRF